MFGDKMKIYKELNLVADCKILHDNIGRVVWLQKSNPH